MTIKNNQLEDVPRKQTKVASDPLVGADQGAFFSKESAGKVEGFFINPHGTVQITENGALKIPPSLVGESNTSSNAGSLGEGLALVKVGVDLPFKRLKAGQNITLNPQSTYVEIIANFPPTQGEANTASNVGLAGAGIFKQKSGVNLEFKRLKAGNNVVISATPDDEIMISAATGGGGGGGALNDLSDVTITSASTGQVLQYNGATWVNASLAAGSGDMLKSVYDSQNNGIVNNSRALNGQNAAYYLARANHTGTQAASTITGLASVATSGSYNDLTNKPTIPTNLNSITDVTAPSPTIGQVLQWSGSAWINATLGAGSGDMLKSVYDSQDNGVVNNSRALNGQNSAYYLARGNHTGTQAASTITGLATVATSGSYNDLTNKPTIPTALSSLTTDVLISSPSSGQFLQWNGTKWANVTVSLSGSGSSIETRLLIFDGGNIAIRASGSGDDLDLVTATKDFSTASRSTLILNKPTSVIYHSVHVVFTAAETTGRTEIGLVCPDGNGATTGSQAIRPFALRFNLTYGIGTSSSTFSLVSGSTFLTLLTGYTAASEQKASFTF